MHRVDVALWTARHRERAVARARALVVLLACHDLEVLEPSTGSTASEMIDEQVRPERAAGALLDYGAVSETSIREERVATSGGGGSPEVAARLRVYDVHRRDVR